MKTSERQLHWDKVYRTKNTDEVSWYQPVPTTSLEFIRELNLSPTAGIIDIGGGDSLLVDNLLEMGFKDITVVDISEEAITKARTRLGDEAEMVSWIVADAAKFKTSRKFDFWHDRAAFHFLTLEEDISNYIRILGSGIMEGGYLLLGTFSKKGPKKCSGLDISQYSEESLQELLAENFSPVKFKTLDHETPSGSIQNFLFGCFQRKGNSYTESMDK